MGNELRNEETMSEFYDLADRFINVANGLTDSQTSTRISSVILFAAARYNVFNFYATGGTKDDEKNGIEYYVDQYRSMLEDNFERTRQLYTVKEKPQ
ncbi:MAG: DUF3144 domain-containing protein [Pyrinomonadaceae bacterium]